MMISRNLALIALFLGGLTACDDSDGGSNSDTDATVRDDGGTNGGDADTTRDDGGTTRDADTTRDDGGTTRDADTTRDAAVTLDQGADDDLGPQDDLGVDQDAAGNQDLGADPDAGELPAVTTATITWNGNTETVIPEVRRGFNYVQPTSGTASAVQGNRVEMNCGTFANPDQGGRVLGITAFNIAGNFNGQVCFDRSVNAEQRLLQEARFQCQGQRFCNFDPNESFALLMAECPYSDILFGVQYQCNALSPAPSFVFDATVGGRSLVVLAMDGLGDVACGANGARFFVDGVPWALAPEAACQVNLTARTARGLAGNIRATLLDPNGNPEALTIDFEHTANLARPIAAINTGTDLCGTNTITHTTVEEDGITYDVFTSDTLTCQANPAATLPGFELRWRHVPDGQPREDLVCAPTSVSLTTGTQSTAISQGGCRSAFRVSEAEGRRAIAFYEPVLCDDQANCTPAFPNVYLQYDLRTAP